nr:pentapeptide repeat-containing protein [Nonomuraea sp. K271]
MPLPGWARWTLAGVALAGASSLAIAFLLGPAARRLAGERADLTPAERRAMTAHERVEAVNAARHTLIQAATGLVVIGGVVFTAQGLWYTAQTLDTTRQGQFTDRYTKAVDQLGAGKLDVRLGGIYALERVARDSARDHQNVYDVLAAFIREHDPARTAKPPARPATDIQAALTTVGRRNVHLDVDTIDLMEIRAPGAKLTGARLARADLSKAILANADLTAANLSGATMREADLTDADLTSAGLDDAHLGDANLTNANLRGANLTNVSGMTEQDIQRQAHVDATTQF